MDWGFLLDDLTTFLVELNKDRANGKRLRNPVKVEVTDCLEYPDKEFKCSKCGEVFPASSKYFHKHKYSRCGLRTICKVCANKKQKEDRKIKKGAITNE